MAIITAVRSGDVAAICTDEAVFRGHVTERAGSKILEAPFGFYAVTGSVAARQAVRTAMLESKSLETEKQMRKLVKRLRAALKAAGWAASKATGIPCNEDFSMVVLTKNATIWGVGTDLSYTGHSDFVAAGAGSTLATGALAAMAGRTWEQRELERCVTQAQRAVEVACERSVWCQWPGVTRTVSAGGLDAGQVKPREQVA